MDARYGDGLEMSRPAAVHQKRILIIEDEEDIQILLDYNLRSEGYTVLQATDGEEGLQQAVEYSPDLILLDWMLPLLSGIEVLRQLRAHSATRDIPVIMLTAKGEETDRLRGLDGGADDYMTKPFSPAELLARVRALLRRTTGGHSTILSYQGIEMDLEKSGSLVIRHPSISVQPNFACWNIFCAIRAGFIPATSCWIVSGGMMCM